MICNSYYIYYYLTYHIKLNNQGVIKLSTKAANKSKGAIKNNQNLNILFKCGHTVFSFQFHTFFIKSQLILSANANVNNIADISKIQWGSKDTISWVEVIFHKAKVDNINEKYTFENNTKIQKNDKKNQEISIIKLTSKLFKNIFLNKIKWFVLYIHSTFCLKLSIKTCFKCSSIGIKKLITIKNINIKKLT